MSSAVDYLLCVIVAPNCVQEMSVKVTVVLRILRLGDLAMNLQRQKRYKLHGHKQSCTGAQRTLPERTQLVFPSQYALCVHRQLHASATWLNTRPPNRMNAPEEI